MNSSLHSFAATKFEFHSMFSYTTNRRKLDIAKRKNSWYAIRFYTHSLCATEWHIGIFFVSMTCGAIGIQGMSIFSSGIQGIDPSKKLQAARGWSRSCPCASPCS
jgi:hypothetical protein